jgi:hypothetical protein
VGSSYRQGPGPAALQENNRTSPAVMHSFVTVPTNGAGQPGGAQRTGTTASPARQMPSPAPSSADGPSDLDGIHAARQLGLQGTKLGNEPEKPDKTIETRKRVVQIFTAGIQHAKQHFASACMEMQLSAKMTEGPERVQLVHKAQVLFDSLHEFSKVMASEAARQLAFQGMKLDDTTKLNIQIFKAGIRCAREHFKSACMETMLSSKMIEGLEQEQLAQKAQILLDSLHGFDKAMVAKSKGGVCGQCGGVGS